MTGKKLLILFFTITSVHLFSQQYNWNQLLYDEDVIGLSVYDMAQDSNGFVWMATDLGMGRYNGKKIELFNKDAGWPVSTKINHFIIDNQQNIWADAQDTCPVYISHIHSKKKFKSQYLTQLGNGASFTSYNDTVFAVSAKGIFIYVNGNVSKHVPIPNHLLTESTVQSISYNPKNKKIYMGFLNNGILTYHLKKNTFSTITTTHGLLNNEITSIYYQQDIGTWVGSPYGVCLLNENDKIKVVDSFLYESKVTKIVSYSNKTYISTFQGIRSYVNGIKKNTYYTVSEESNPGNFYSVLITKDGTILGGSAGDIKSVRSPFINKFGPAELSESPIYGNTSDSNGNFYLGQIEQFFVKMKFDGNSIIQADTIRTPHYAFHTFIHPISGKVIISGFTGFGEYDGKTYKNLSSGVADEFYIYSSWFDATDSSVYIGTGFGAVKIRNNKISFVKEFRNGKEEVSSTVFLGVANKTGNFIATKWGVRQIIHNQIEDIPGMEKYPGLRTEVYSMVGDKYNNVWADVNNNSILRIYKKNNALQLKLYDVKKLYNVKGPFKLITKGDSLWIKTFSKIYLLNLSLMSDEKMSLIHTLDLSDGINDDYPHGGMYHADKHGNLWMSTGEGLQVIKYSEIALNPEENKNHLLNIKVNGENIDLDKYSKSISAINDVPDQLELPYYLNELSFDYVGLCYKNQDKVKYKVKLEGYEKDWSLPSTESYIRYSNLAPGTYTFKFYSCNNDGIWNLHPYEFKFKISPPWWNTWWFKTIIALVLLLIIYLIFNWRIQLLKQKNKRQEKLTEDILHAQEAERQRIAVDLHDSIGQELSLLKLNAQKENYHIILPKINKVIEEVRLIARNIHPKEFELGGFDAALEKLIDEANELGNTEFVIESISLNNTFEKNKQLILFRIIQECVNNIVKHSEAKNAKITILSLQHKCQLIVQDNGKGFNPSNISTTSLGMDTMKERTKLLGGKIMVKSSVGNGTEITIEIPL